MTATDVPEDWPPDLRVANCAACGKLLCGRGPGDEELARTIPWRDRPSGGWLRCGRNRPWCSLCHRKGLAGSKRGAG